VLRGTHLKRKKEDMSKSCHREMFLFTIIKQVWSLGWIPRLFKNNIRPSKKGK